MERYILNLSDFLHQQNPHMHFLLLTDKSAVPILHGRKIPKRQKFSSLEVYRLGPNLASLLRDFLYSFNLRPKLLENLFLCSLYREAAHWQTICDVDIFHVHGIWEPRYPIIGLLLSQHFHRPLIISLHGDAIGSRPFEMPIETAEMFSVLKHANAIITYSKKILKRLKVLGLNHKSYLIPNFVDTKSFNRPTRIRYGLGTKVVMVSRLDLFKDPITPVLAFQYVLKKMPKASLQIVGYGPLYEHLKLLIKKLNLEHAVFLLGKQENVRPFLWNSDIFLTGDAYMSILEAWSAGLAVVAFDAETTRSIISNGKNGILVPPKKPLKLASVLLDLMKDDKLRVTLATNGLQTVKNYDINVVAPMIGGIYESILKNSA